MIIANIDSTISAPKLPATLLLYELQPKTRKRYRRYVNGVAIRALPYYSVVCLSDVILPKATLHTGIAIQMVDTKKQDLLPVTYNQNSIHKSFNSNFSLIFGDPPQRTPIPTLLSLISFSQKASPDRPRDLDFATEFFAFCVHVPLFSVGLAMSRGPKEKGRSRGWQGLLASGPRDGPTLKSFSNDEIHLEKSVPNLSNVLQLSIGKLNFEIFNSLESNKICSSISIGRISFKDAAGKNLLMSTALLKHYFGSSRINPGINFNPLQGFPRLAAPTSRRSTTEFSTNQIDASLLFSTKSILGGIELRCSRLEIGVDSLQLIDSCARALLKSIKDLKALAVTFPALQFGSSQYSSAQLFPGFAQFGFGSILYEQKDLPSSSKSLTLDGLLPPLFFIPHIPDVLRNVALFDTRERLRLKDGEAFPEQQDQQTVPRVFQLRLFPYYLPCHLVFEEASEGTRSEDSEEGGLSRHRLTSGSVFEQLAFRDSSDHGPSGNVYSAATSIELEKKKSYETWATRRPSSEIAE